MTMKYRDGLSLLVLLLVVPVLGLSQAAQENRTLTVNGQPGQVTVIQINGRSYVDLEALARVANGSLSFSGNQIALTLPGTAASYATPAAAAPSSPPPNPGFSREFLKAGIEQMATIREWHSALASAIQNNYPVSGDWLTPYRSQAATNLRFASVAATTDSDRRAYQLLSNEFQNMKNLSDRYAAARANMTYIAPDSLESDSLNQRIVACGHSLGAMAASGQFVDDGSCH